MRAPLLSSLFCSLLMSCNADTAKFTPSEHRVASAGNGHTCNVRFSGEIACWGWNQHGQLGDGTKDNSSVPLQIGSAAVWEGTAAGEHHTCGIRNDSWLWCWGWNEHGQLGTGDTNDQLVPLQADAGELWTQVTAGSTHTCAIRSNGSLWCWGNNNVGQIGNGLTGALQKSLEPEQIADHVDWVDVQAGHSHTCGLRGEGILFCWGNNVKGQLGDGTTEDQAEPREVALGYRWKSIDTGYFHTCGITADGRLWCWGENFSGQLGTGATGGLEASPAAVGDDTTWAQVALGDYHSCARRTDNTIWCWGDNNYGQLGDGNAGDAFGRPLPVQISAEDRWIDLTSGNDHTCGLLDDDTLWCWGRNDYGQLGDGTNANRALPVAVTEHQ